MPVTFNRPRGLKYTDMAIYIDAHLPDIKVPDQHPEVEAKIYEYIYHILYALACKSGYFKNFADYDSFACYGAAELFFSMRRKLINEGKEIRGKTVVPIKSSLNFIKATMFPLKVNYQREAFNQVLNPAGYTDDIYETIDDNESREEIQKQYRRSLAENLADTVSYIPNLLKQVIDNTPFRSDALMRKKLQLSIMLTFLDDITIPNKLKNKIKSKMTDDNNEKIINKLLVAYETNPDNVILWHLPEGYSTYVRFLTQKLKRWLSKELQVMIHSDDLSEDIIDSVMMSVLETYTAEDSEY